MSSVCWAGRVLRELQAKHAGDQERLQVGGAKIGSI